MLASQGTSQPGEHGASSNKILGESPGDVTGGSGDPSWGQVIQVDSVEIGLGDETRYVVICDRAILLFRTDNEDARRLHRFFSALERAADDSSEPRRVNSRSLCHANLLPIPYIR